MMSTKHLAEEEVSFIRFIGQVMMYAPFILLLQLRLEQSKWLIMAVLSVIGYMNPHILYFTLSMIPLSTVLSITATCPFFACLLSVCILKQKL